MITPSRRSNRTFMELKYSGRSQTLPFTMCSNRTFMELKLNCLYQYPSRIPSSNRTFMELKFDTMTEQIDGKIVLIVPLWN